MIDDYMVNPFEASSFSMTIKFKFSSQVVNDNLETLWVSMKKAA